MQHGRVQRVQVHERVGHMQRDGDFGSVEAELAALRFVRRQQRAQVTALHVLQDSAQVRERVPRDADEVDDARVVEQSQQSHFVQKVVDVLDALTKVREQHLEGDLLSVVESVVDFTVSSAVDQLLSQHFSRGYEM